jgi:hypothetical protein
MAKQLASTIDLHATGAATTFAGAKAPKMLSHEQHVGCAFLGTASTDVGVDRIDQHPRIGFTATFTEVTGLRS